MKIFILLSLFLCNIAIASEAQKLIEEGINLHDSGQYALAIDKYKLALQLEPDNPLALYELTYAYTASKQNEDCVDTAQQGLDLDPKLKKQFIMALGSCQSQLGMYEDAIATFKMGLGDHPDDAHLHLNIAVTFSNIKEDKQAIKHLKESVKYSNGYASPYYFLAEMYRATGYRIPAMYFYMQFVLLEPNTQRSDDASSKVFSLLYQTASRQNNGDITIFADPNQTDDEGDFSALDLALSLAVATATTEEKKNETQRYIDDLVSFVQICKEIEDDKLASTFTWQYAARNMINLQSNSTFETFSYILAARAGSQYASEWLNNNKDKIKELSSAIQNL